MMFGMGFIGLIVVVPAILGVIALVLIKMAESLERMEKVDILVLDETGTFTKGNIRQNLVFAFAYNAIGIPVAAGALYPAFGILLSPVVAALAMSLSSVSVIASALRLRAARL